MKTVRLTMSQALIKFLDNQYIEFDKQQSKFVTGVWGIFGHGCVVGIGEALEADDHSLRFYQGKSEQGMAQAAVAYAKQHCPELNPTEHLRDEIQEKFFPNLVFQSLAAVESKLVEAVLYLENNPSLVQSITGFLSPSGRSFTWPKRFFSLVIRPSMRVRID